MSDPNALPIAGWYPDPENEAGDRWWNGATWSDHRRPRNAGTGWAPAADGDEAAPAIPVPPPAASSAPYHYAPAHYAPTQRMQNPLAFAGMLTSLIGLLFNWILWGAPGIVGAILSFVGLRRANALTRQGATAGNGKGMAIVGIVAGLVGAFLFNVFFFTTWSPIMFS